MNTHDEIDFTFDSSSTIFTENSFDNNNKCSDEILFQDNVMVKMSVKSDWKKVSN